MSLNSPTVKPHYFQSRKRKERIKKLIIVLLLISGSMVILVPFWWMISISLKSMPEVMAYPPTWFPKKYLWNNYVEAWKAAPFLRYTLNTLFLAFFAIVGNVLSNTFVAYGFSKIRFRGKRFLFSVLLGTMMIPGFVTLVPQYVMFAKIHWVGSYLPLIVPHFFSGAFSVFMLRQFFLTIPNDLIEAAKMDGANHFYIWMKIMLPLSKPAVATIAIFSFDGAWNDFLGPLLYVNKESLYTLQIGLTSFKSAIGVSQWNYLMAGSLMVLVPVIVLFFMFQRYFIEGMNLTAGTKG